VWVRELGPDVEVRYGHERIAVHARAARKHVVVTEAEHHREIPLGARQQNKTVIQIRDTAPVVEVRPLAAYEAAVSGGGR
jgi:hypothetical protein